MTPFFKTVTELEYYDKEELISHINWLYKYIEKIKNN